MFVTNKPEVAPPAGFQNISKFLYRTKGGFRLIFRKFRAGNRGKGLFLAPTKYISRESTYKMLFNELLNTVVGYLVVEKS